MSLVRGASPLGSTPAVVGAGRVREAIRGPHAILGGVAGTVVLCELAARETGASAFMMVAAGVALAGFVAVWRLQDRLRIVLLLGLTLGFQLAWILLHLRLGVTSLDSSVLYRRWGNTLLDGDYPESQYPPGGVLLFALDAWLGGGATRTSHAVVMVPFQLLTVAAVWGLRTRTTPWLAALVALWPMNAFFWEFRFDLVPTALLALGLLLAQRGRWTASGALLGLGAAVKWIPGVAFAFLALWLLAAGRRRDVGKHVVAFIGVFGLAHVPFLLWDAEATTYAYRYFGGQGLTGESVWYLLLAPIGLASVDPREFWLPADVPSWADPATVAIQGALLLLLAAAAVRVRASVHAGVAIAAVAPVIFLLANRVFSPQYLVLILAAWAIAGALVLERRRDQLVLGLLAMAATTANAFVYPYTLYQLELWRAASAVLFGLGFATSAWIVWHALRSPSLSRSPSTGPVP